MVQEAPLKIKLLDPVTSDPIYAVDKAGDFSKASVREKDWPGDAEKKQPLTDLNENKSEGAKRFENAVARVIQLGDLPRGIVGMSISASNDEHDNAMGVITLPASSPQKEYEKRLESLNKDVEYTHNHPQSFELPKKKPKLTDENETGKQKEGDKKPALETSSVEAGFKTKSPMINPGTFRNKELSTL